MSARRTPWGFIASGFTSGYITVIDYIDLTINSGNALDGGDVAVARTNLPSGVYGSVFGFIGGGQIQAGNALTDIIEYMDITINSGNSVDRGDLTVARNTLAGIAGTIYGFWCGGNDGGSSDVIDYIDITLTTGNATDRGNLQSAKQGACGI